MYKDKEPHLYTLVLRPDNTFSILVDNKEVNSGSLLEDFTPPVNPPEEVDDPEDTKPEDWDEREKVRRWVGTGDGRQGRNARCFPCGTYRLHIEKEK